jgi:hypothetical protein
MEMELLPGLHQDRMRVHGRDEKAETDGLPFSLDQDLIRASG